MIEETKNQFHRLGIKTGLAMCLLFIGYFLLMKALGFGHISELRYLNFLILIGGLIFVFHHFKQPDQSIDYLSGIGLGFIATAASVIPFAMFLYIYFSYIDMALLETIKKSSDMMGSYLTPFAITGSIVIEGLASGGIISFVIMQYYKSGFEKHTRKWFGSKGKSEFLNH